MSSLTKEEFAKISELVSKARFALDKKSAEPYIRELQFLCSYCSPPARNVFNDLIGYVKQASGQVKNKEHWLEAVEQSLYKLESFVDK